MKKILDYKMVSANDNVEVAEKVNELLKEDWELYGNPFKANAYYNQAMVIVEDPAVTFGFTTGDKE